MNDEDAKTHGSLHVTVDGNTDEVEVIPLGGAQEVGRSCIFVRWRGRSLLLDCGLHPAIKGPHSLPFLDAEEVDLETVDAVLVTHFHHDHCAALPYLVGQTNFQGRVLMTHPTRAVLGTLLRDTVKLASASGEQPLYDEADVEEALRRTEVISFRQTKDINGIAVTALAAGHVLGAAMFLIEWDGLRLLYTGDYSRVPDRHLAAAELPSVPPHVVIAESTCGQATHESTAEREAKLTSIVSKVVLNGGRVLIPCVAIGRAQEIMLVLDEFWDKNPELQGVPIYQASGQAQRAQSVYQAYVEMMNDRIRDAFARVANPFHFKHIQVLASGSEFDDVGPCVVLASPAMLQNGFSRVLLEQWCGDPANAIVLADFHVQGTMARDLTMHPQDIVSMQGYKLPMRAQVETVSFWAHADWPQMQDFLKHLNAEHIVLVHGEKSEMFRLKQALERDAETLEVRRTVYTPANKEPVVIPHRPHRRARLVGRLAASGLSKGDTISGVIVRPEGAAEDTILDPHDLPGFTRLTTGAVRQRQALPIKQPFGSVRLALETMFEGVEPAELREETEEVGVMDVGEVGPIGPMDAKEEKGMDVKGEKVEKGAKHGTRDKGVERFVLGESLRLEYRPPRKGSGTGSLMMEWEGSPMNDLLADAVVATVMMVEGRPGHVGDAEKERQECLSKGDLGGAMAAEAKIMTGLLEAQFGEVEADERAQWLRIKCGGDEAVRIDMMERAVEMEAIEPTPAGEQMKGRIEAAANRIWEAMDPISLQE